MALKQVLEIYELLDNSKVSGEGIKTFFRTRGLNQVAVHRMRERKSFTDFIHILIPGRRGKNRKGGCKTLGIIGFLGGIGASPDRSG